MYTKKNSVHLMQIMTGLIFSWASFTRLNPRQLLASNDICDDHVSWTKQYWKKLAING